MAAHNITKDLISRLIKNGDTAEGWRPSGWWALGGLVAVGVSEYDKLSKFRDKVRGGADWDFKSNWLRGDRNDGVEVAGKVYRYDMPGNFHFGFTGAAADISDWLLFSQAGKAQRAAGTSKPEYWCTNDDDPEDHEFIRLGIKLYNDVGLAVTETSLMQVLSFFRAEICGPPPEREQRGFKQ